MKIFKHNPEATVPEFATEGSAAFDLRVCLSEGDTVKTINPHNRELKVPAKRASNGLMSIQIQPQFRVLIPTGLIFDIPAKHVMKIFIRSSMALKNGINLANNTAIIDSDYTDPTYVMLYNMCDTPVILYHGDRIAQAMLEKSVSYKLEETLEAPGQKTDRVGGLGSTGTK